MPNYRFIHHINSLLARNVKYLFLGVCLTPLLNKLLPLPHQLFMIFRGRQIIQKLDRVLTQSLLDMRLTCGDPLLHAPARKDRTYIVAILIFFERGGCRDIALARTNIMDFIETHMRVVELESACKTQSLIDDLVTIDKGQG